MRHPPLETRLRAGGIAPAGLRCLRGDRLHDLDDRAGGIARPRHQRCLRRLPRRDARRGGPGRLRRPAFLRLPERGSLGGCRARVPCCARATATRRRPPTPGASSRSAASRGSTAAGALAYGALLTGSVDGLFLDTAGTDSVLVAEGGAAPVPPGGTFAASISSARLLRDERRGRRGVPLERERGVARQRLVRALRSRPRRHAWRAPATAFSAVPRRS